MRILRVAQKLYPDVKGGGAYHVHAMSRDQAAMGNDITVLTVGEGKRRESRSGYDVVQFPSTAELLGNDISAGVAKYLRHQAAEFDVLHAHSHLYSSTNIAALVRRLRGTPLAITNHGLYSQNAPKWLFKTYLRTVGKWTFDSADVVFCYTDEDEQRIRNFGVNSEIKVISNGVDTSRFTPDGPTSNLIQHDGPVILFVGRLVEGKRPQEAEEAVARLPDELDAKLYVVGDGPLREALGNHVNLLGHVAYDEMPSIYRSGDVLILPSHAEGLPRTVLEAFASGVPVVSSYLEHTASVVERAGETVPVGDIGGYAAALQRVLDERKTLGELGREAALKEFRWQDTVDETTVALKHLL